MISDAAAGHTLIDIVVADPTHGDLVDRAARKDLVAATNAERRKEAHCRDRTSGTKFVPFALEAYGALSARSDLQSKQDWNRSLEYLLIQAVQSDRSYLAPLTSTPWFCP